jgi:hypothetical protein
MFRISRKTLTFPEIVYQGKVTFGNSGKGETSLFSLDWNRFLDDIRYHHREENQEGPLKLSHHFYSDILEGPFAVPQKYLREIRHFSQFSIIDRSRERHFDPSMRDVCLSVSNSAANAAFKLLADCYYDKAENNYYRGPDKVVIPYVLMVAFWANQTNRAMVENYAEIPYLQNLVNTYDGQDIFPQEEIDEIKKFLRSFKSLKATWEQAVKGPELTEEEMELFDTAPEE